jgi:DNA-binding MarR family transcriptional regulator
MAPASTPRLSPSLGFLQHVWALNHALERVSAEMDRRLGVSAPQRLILRCLAMLPQVTPSELASTLHVDPGTVSAGLRRLEQKGLVERERDSADMRRVRLRLTSTGRMTARPAQGTVEAAVDRLLTSVSERDLNTTLRVLEHLTEFLTEQLNDDSKG